MHRWSWAVASSSSCCSTCARWPAASTACTYGSRPPRPRWTRSSCGSAAATRWPTPGSLDPATAVLLADAAYKARSAATDRAGERAESDAVLRPARGRSTTRSVREQLDQPHGRHLLDEVARGGRAGAAGPPILQRRRGRDPAAARVGGSSGGSGWRARTAWPRAFEIDDAPPRPCCREPARSARTLTSHALPHVPLRRGSRRSRPRRRLGVAGPRRRLRPARRAAPRPPRRPRPSEHRRRRPTPTPSPTPPVQRSLLSGRIGAADGPVLVVKFDNTRNSSRTPGLPAADVVYLEQVEGGLTRYAAVFSSEDPQAWARSAARGSPTSSSSRSTASSPSPTPAPRPSCGQ